MSNWTPEQFQRLVARGMVDARDLLPRAAVTATVPPATKPCQASGKSPKPRGRAPMNKTETAFSLILEARRRKGEIDRWEREGMTLRWEDGMTYTPDFAVFQNAIGSPMPAEMPRNVQIVFFETKGPRIEEDALVKFRAARAHWPEFRFEMHQLCNGQWAKII